MSVPQIDAQKLPQHIAIIMDGNGRWAKEQGLNRIYGHKEGVISVREAVNTCAEIGIKYLTLYAFSSENWNRPKAEVDALMEILVATLQSEFESLHQNNIKLSMIGNLNDLPKSCQIALTDVMEKTKHNTRMTLVLALSYGSRQELVMATQKIAQQYKDGQIALDDITEEYITKQLYSADIPDPELLIRTSGEERISNFLLYQIAYTELYFTKINWPAFRKQELLQAIADYQQRERRFGLTSEQIQNNI